MTFLNGWVMFNNFRQKFIQLYDMPPMVNPLWSFDDRTMEFTINGFGSISLLWMCEEDMRIRLIGNFCVAMMSRRADGEIGSHVFEITNKGEIFLKDDQGRYMRSYGDGTYGSTENPNRRDLYFDTREAVESFFDLIIATHKEVWGGIVS